MTLVEGVSCGAVAARVRDAVQSGKLNSILQDFGAAGPPPPNHHLLRPAPTPPSLILSLSRARVRVPSLASLDYGPCDKRIDDRGGMQVWP